VFPGLSILPLFSWEGETKGDANPFFLSLIKKKKNVSLKRETIEKVKRKRIFSCRRKAKG
jgi:hypothetical protein